jgi:multisubunit Na+/H+ antiporter MnhB subunit
MTSRERISASGTRLLAPLIAGLGVLIIVRTLAAGGGALSAGVLLGAVFVAIGIGRLYLLSRARS